MGDKPIGAAAHPTTRDIDSHPVELEAVEAESRSNAHREMYGVYVQ